MLNFLYQPAASFVCLPFGVRQKISDAAFLLEFAAYGCVTINLWAVKKKKKIQGAKSGKKSLVIPFDIIHFV